MLGVSPLLGADATREAVTGGATRSQLIHLATHGVADDENPDVRSYLLVSDGALTARRIAKLNLRPDQLEALRKRPIVVMSACDTALGERLSRE
jgi:CHAT domain-containing protein